MTDSGKYEVGYGKPPKNGQFRKGQSGNPRGRSKGDKNIATLLERALENKVVLNENGKRRVITKRQAIILQIVNKAASGDHRAIQQVLSLEMTLGDKMKQQTQLHMTEADRETMQMIAGRLRDSMEQEA